MKANLIGKGQLRNKAKLRDGAIVEYDEAIEVDPENPETPKPTVNFETEYLGVGEIVEVQGTPQTQNGRLVHLWEYLGAHKTGETLIIFNVSTFYNLDPVPPGRTIYY